MTFKLLKGPLNSRQTLAVVFTTPTQRLASWSMNINIFSQLLNPCIRIFPDVCIRLTIRKIRTGILKNCKSVYP